jgi:hypothetical protein
MLKLKNTVRTEDLLYAIHEAAGAFLGAAIDNFKVYQR